tara:strand:+ start:287 stop:721 length:435 start_codon:yes stop_codon:yes gene_type:complete
MKINRNKLRRVIHKTIREGMSLSGGPPVRSGADKIKTQLQSFDRSFIIQAYQMCELLPDLDFTEIVREMVNDMIENSHVADSIHETVSNMLEILHDGKTQIFYIEDENVENDVQMEFAFKTVTDIMENLKEYYVNYFVAVGQGQ